jgi:hypothetical protein
MSQPNLQELINKQDYHKIIFDEETLVTSVNNRYNVIIQLIISNQIKSIPPKYLTPKILTKPCRQDWTALHEIALQGAWKYIPEKTLKKLNFNIIDEMGNTPLHIAAKGSKFENVPLKFLTLKHFTIKNKDNQTVISQLNKTTQKIIINEIVKNTINKIPQVTK